MSRARMKEKIAALRAKTRSAGCTEAEAMAAAELAAKLMADHGLSDAEMTMSEASAREDTSRATWRTPLAEAIAHCTNTAAILLVDGQDGGSEILFMGRDPGPEIAIYLRDVCFRAVARELKAFKAATFYRRRRTVATRRQAASDFVAALVQRLMNRLMVLFCPTVDKTARLEARAALQVRFEGGVAMRMPERKMRFSDAAAAGWVAGGNVALNHGLGADAGPGVALLGELGD
ncbi:DUF2786 domain-containing protein [Methylobacterium sp. WL6]|uniref:DUF7168 domain-containing protein n=1 Tax=Methylobacterium sp. WL6 TaxID=2603901 RepID=UPI0011C910D6|nr:DUF2786 domain-containing protein [Methylobacterium sp. WL6]TXN71635.1 DUF2786 domain-containing protein [Methylobacterium sp. WL6]